MRLEPAGDKEGIEKGRPYHAVYYYKEGYFYKAVFKVTKNYKEIYLLSLIKSESGENFKPEAYQKHKSRKR